MARSGGSGCEYLCQKIPQIMPELSVLDDFSAVNIVDSVKNVHVQEKSPVSLSAWRYDSRTEAKLG